MKFVAIELGLVALMALAVPAFAQENGATDKPAAAESSAAADLEFLMARAAQTPFVRSIFEQFRRNGQDRDLRTFVLSRTGFGGRADAVQGDFPYRTYSQFQVAEARALQLAAILSNDLDGDGYVTRDEIAKVLPLAEGRRASVADILIRFDGNRDDVLSPNEIEQAVAESAERRGNRDTIAIAEALDFDDDGIVTVAEFDRARAALLLPAPLTQP